MADTNPIRQFEIHPIVPMEVNGIDLSFTNSSYFMAVAVLGVTALMWLATTKRALVPSRGQSVAEMLYEFVAGMIRSTAGTEGLRFFPFVFTLFMFILTVNMLGMMHYFPVLGQGWHGFTVTSHIIVTFALSMLVMVIVVGYGVWKNGFKFLKLFVPSGVPLPLYAIVTPIEVISFLSRPLSLSVRLFANMLAGHILLKVFAGFIVMMGTAGVLGFLGATLPLFMVVALTALEFLVAFLQAYVFAILTCIYLNDALHPGH